MNSLIPLSPFGREIYLVDKEGEPYVAMRAICEAMGMAWQPQHRKLMESRLASVVTEMVTTAHDGKHYSMVCLPLRKLPGWLMTIHPNKVRADIRDRVNMYLDRCDDVLWEHWNDCRKPKPPTAAELLLNQAELLVQIERRLKKIEAGRLFTIMEYAEKKNMHISYEKARLLSHKAREYSLANNLAIGTVSDDKHGTRRTYTEFVLRHVFDNEL